MEICLIVDNPDTLRHPVLGPLIRHLNATHGVRLFDVLRLTGDEAIAQEADHARADLYLLKSHAPQAMSLAHHLEERGAVVVNSWASSSICQDRVRMVERLSEARLPCPRTWSVSSLDAALGQIRSASTLPFPLVIKSRFSRRGDLVDTVHGAEELAAHARAANQEPFVLQEFVPGNGWDFKIWVIDGELFAARRRSSLERGAGGPDVPISTEALGSEWVSMTLEIGRVFDLRLYGVDWLMTGRGPVVIDVNSFPGFRGVAGAESALIALVERLLLERLVDERQPAA